MVKAEDTQLFQQHSACHLPNLNILPSPVNHGIVSADVDFPGFGVPGFCSPGTDQANEARGLFQCFLPPRVDSFPSTYNPCVKKEPSSFCNGDRVKASPHAVFESTQKRFVIFDRSGNHTRLFFSALHSHAQNPSFSPIKSIGACELRDEGKEARIEQFFPNFVEEKSDENKVNGEGSEMHEDTEEINALLYSDYDGDDSEEDEVTSTDRSPCAIKGTYKELEHMEEKTAEIGNSESSKRQRLIDGGYKKSSLMDIVSSAKLDGVGSSRAKGRTRGEDLDPVLGTEQSRKDKIRETLKILESLIPGEKSKDPLLVIEEAISYLKYLKVKAKALGVGKLPLIAAAPLP